MMHLIIRFLLSNQPHAYPSLLINDAINRNYSSNVIIIIIGGLNILKKTANHKHICNVSKASVAFSMSIKNTNSAHARAHHKKHDYY